MLGGGKIPKINKRPLFIRDQRVTIGNNIMSD